MPVDVLVTVLVSFSVRAVFAAIQWPASAGPAPGPPQGGHYKEEGRAYRPRPLYGVVNAPGLRRYLPNSVDLSPMVVQHRYHAQSRSGDSGLGRS
jgi:hypothetical protein